VAGILMATANQETAIGALLKEMDPPLVTAMVAKSER
jgi:hypothetical protein